jgi:hypothetical protein
MRVFIMSDCINRRHFLRKTLQAGTFAGLTDLGFLSKLQAGSVSRAKAPLDKVQLSPNVEPLARLIEDTPRNQLLETIGERINNGLTYEEILTALFLAGVRDIQPRPVGFKFHAVMVINSVHLASTAASEKNRWLPLFWALDNFKDAQARNRREGGWYMKSVEESRLPADSKAKQLFIESMDRWDEAGADQAITSLARSNDPSQLTELFWRFGARDFRDIGHKAIYTANGTRTMQYIGWRCAEPFMRSLAYALLDHDKDNPDKNDYEADRPGRENLERVTKIRSGWQSGKINLSDVPAFLSILRSASPGDSSQSVVEFLNKEVDPASLWDGLFLRAAELLSQKPGILTVHCVTSMNALHYGFHVSSNDETRRLLLLQAAAFLPLFRQLLGLGKISADEQVDSFQKIEISSPTPAHVEEIFADVAVDSSRAARKTLGFLDAGGDPKAIMESGRRLVFAKGTDSHDYKFSSAAFEDYYHVSPAWRNRYLAASTNYLCGSGEHDNSLIKRMRAVLGRKST